MKRLGRFAVAATVGCLTACGGQAAQYGLDALPHEGSDSAAGRPTQVQPPPAQLPLVQPLPAVPLAPGGGYQAAEFDQIFLDLDRSADRALVLGMSGEQLIDVATGEVIRTYPSPVYGKLVSPDFIVGAIPPPAQSDGPQEQRVAYFSPADGVVDLCPLWYGTPYSCSSDRLIGGTEAGAIYGNRRIGDTNSYEAFVWTKAGGIAPVSGPAGASDIDVVAVHPSGCLGILAQRNGAKHGFVRTPSGVWSDLGENHVPWSVNQNGHAAGDFPGSDGRTHAFLWDGMTMQDLGGWTSLPLQAVFGLNAADTVLGSKDVVGADWGSTVVIWQQGKVIDLSPVLLPHGEQRLIYPLRLNDRGTVVAESFAGRTIVLRFK